MLLRSLSFRSVLGVVLLLAGCVLAVVAAWLVYRPAGVAAAGVLLFVGGYVILYLEARNASDRQSAASQ